MSILQLLLTFLGAQSQWRPEISSRCLELVDFTIDTHELLHRSLALLRQFEPTIEISEGTPLILKPQHNSPVTM